MWNAVGVRSGIDCFRYTKFMAKVVDPRSLPDQTLLIPGLKAPVWEFEPSDEVDPTEVDAFNHMIRELRRQNPESQNTRR